MWDSKRKHLIVAAAVTVLLTPDFIAPLAAHGSDRFVEGTSPVLIRTAKILTGARNGTEVVFGDVLLDKGIILGVGYIPRALLRPNLQVIDAEGKWISPGIVDSHSNLGVYSAPALEGGLPDLASDQLYLDICQRLASGQKFCGVHTECNLNVLCPESPVAKELREGASADAKGG
ncbi:hypothetical protein B0H13DRAFT_2266275 [Mycena leptocephala]|nr:hypothetical protein B0H13DRAFT_2266275 [Mycena leptocephala]